MDIVLFSRFSLFLLPPSPSLRLSQYIADDTCMEIFTWLVLPLHFVYFCQASFLNMLHIMAHYKIPNLSGVP